jgi:uncharacterized protein YoxC
MTDVALIVLIIVIIVIGVLIVPVILELRRTLRRINNFLDSTEQSLTPAIDNLNSTIERINSIMADIQLVSQGTKEMADNIKHLSGKIQDIVEGVDELRKEASSNVSAIKAALRVGINTLIKNLLKGGG